MTRPRGKKRAAVLAVGALASAAYATSASASTVTVNYGNCQSNKPTIAAPPPNYSAQVTLTPQGSGFQVGKAITITWHYGTSTAPVAIPIANAATAKAKILVSGAASSTIVTGSSAAFPSAPVNAGGTFQIPDMTATFTPSAAGTYSFTPGDNEEDISIISGVITCTASGASSAATVTVTAAGGSSGGGSGGGGTTSTHTSTHTSTSSSSSNGGSASSSSASSGSSQTSDTATDTTSPSATDSSSTGGTLPHTGFNGGWLLGGVGAAALLGTGALLATRRRRGGHS